jgi:hypothetical protein
MLLEAATANHTGPTYSLPLFPDGEGRIAGNGLGPRERGELARSPTSNHRAVECGILNNMWVRTGTARAFR